MGMGDATFTPLKSGEIGPANFTVSMRPRYLGDKILNPRRPSDVHSSGAFIQWQELACLADLSLEILARRSRRDLGAGSAGGPFHDDVAADESHDRPAGHVPTFIY